MTFYFSSQETSCINRNGVVEWCCTSVEAPRNQRALGVWTLRAVKVVAYFTSCLRNFLLVASFVRSRVPRLRLFRFHLGYVYRLLRFSFFSFLIFFFFFFFLLQLLLFFLVSHWRARFPKLAIARSRSRRTRHCVERSVVARNYFMPRSSSLFVVIWMIASLACV